MSDDMLLKINACCARVASEFRRNKREFTMATLKAIVAKDTQFNASFVNVVVSRWANDTENNGGFYVQKGPGGGIKWGEVAAKKATTENDGNCCPLCATGLREIGAKALSDELRDPKNADLLAMLKSRSNAIIAGVEARKKHLTAVAKARSVVADEAPAPGDAEEATTEAAPGPDEAAAGALVESLTDSDEAQAL